MKRWYLALLGSLLALGPVVSIAQTIDVLWYAYSPPGAESQYREKMQDLADNAHTYAPGSGLRWEVTFFGPSDPAPDFSAFDVLVTQSSLFSGDDVDPSYAGILDNREAIEAARGSRTLLTGLDPDFHYILDSVPVDDGPRGTLVNFINWAGSGIGLGIVALDNEDVQWWARTDSFLRDEVLDFIIGDCCAPQFIPDFAADYPINAGLTDAGLTRSSGGATHTGFDLDMPGYVAIHQSIGNDEELTGTTMVTAAEAAGVTTPQAEEYWCEALLPPLDRAVSLASASQRMIPVRMQLLDGMGDVVTAEDLSQPPQLQVRFGATTQLVGPLIFNAGPGVWTGRVDTSQFPAPGTYTVEAVAGDDSYEVELCEQTFTRQ